MDKRPISETLLHSKENQFVFCKQGRFTDMYKLYHHSKRQRKNVSRTPADVMTTTTTTTTTTATEAATVATATTTTITKCLKYENNVQ